VYADAGANAAFTQLNAIVFPLLHVPVPDVVDVSVVPLAQLTVVPLVTIVVDVNVVPFANAHEPP